jgi:hypothetical protein
MRLAIAALLLGLSSGWAQSLPSGPLVIRDFTLRFAEGGAFSLSGAGWPSMSGTWSASGNEVTIQATPAATRSPLTGRACASRWRARTTARRGG